jgi:MATE family multidrug resistance protein
LPGQIRAANGRLRLDYAAVARLAFPFMLNSAVQAVLNATDTWFIGRISPAATAGIAAVYWPILVFVLLLGGISLSVQTLVAQAVGAGHRLHASQATWTALWGSMLTIPLFAALAFAGARLFSPFAIPPVTLVPALQYWYPRMLGAPLGVALWCVLGFFNGIARPMVTLQLTCSVAIANALFNQLFIVGLGWGIAGSAWATDASLLLGLGGAMALFLGPDTASRYGSRLTLRLLPGALIGQFRLGFPMGLLYAADIFGFALFQLMQVRLGTLDAAATQIVMVLTSFCYMPAVGIAMAGTTLVGQAIGGNRPDWAYTVGNGIIRMAVLYMGLTGLALAAGGPWILPLFTNGSAPGAALITAKGALFLWIAAGYQLFDGLNISCGACLRGAGDAFVPAMLVITLSWGLFVPLAHSLAFEPGAGWVRGLPQFGWGSIGAWCAAVIYMACLGSAILLRWRSGAWRRIALGA